MRFTDVRPEVAAFALLMEEKLRENDHKRFKELIMKVIEEVRDSEHEHALFEVGQAAKALAKKRRP